MLIVVDSLDHICGNMPKFLKRMSDIVYKKNINFSSYTGFSIKFEVGGG